MQGLHVEDTGGSGEVVLFSHGLLWSARMFEHQVSALRDRYRCVSWDHRGQGRSEVPAGSSVSIESLTADAVELIEGLNCGPVHFVGLSMGGFVGMRIAARRPDLVRSLCLMDTAPDPEPTANARKYGRMSWVARIFGVVGPLADQVMPVMFADSVLSDPRRKHEVAAWRALMMQNRRSVYKAVRGVLERESVEHEIGAITCPTLVLWGAEDKAIARERAQLCVQGIPNASWVEIEGAGHSSSMEQPERVTQAVAEFLTSATPVR